jgi:NAD(P)-dependent dehydrogenase (short-subunit alcohol dehydrogenase family)
MNIDLTGKRVLVTGASSGIGAAIAKQLGSIGARVAVNYRSGESKADESVSQIEQAGGEAFKVEADVSDVDAVERMFAKVDDRFGGIDILINNAGIDGKRVLSWDIDPADWKKVIDVNLMGSFYCARQALKRMVPANEGVILNVSSVHEEIAWSGQSAYTASKAGISMMMKSMAQEASPHGVRVLSVAPGAIRTPINEDVWSDPESMEGLKKLIPMDRIGEPEEIAKMVAVLVSDVGSYVTGETVFIDGGMTDYPSFAKGG